MLFNRGQEDARLSQVTSANRAGGRKVAEHLVACGHRRIAHISGWAGSMTGRDRADGFAEGLDAAGLDLLKVIDGEYRWEKAAQATRTLIDECGPDAIFVGNDVMAFSVMDTLRYELGMSVPDDVAVVGYDDVAMAAWPAYDLTTVRQPADEMVDATIDILVDRIEHADAPPKKVEIDGPLIVRGSTRPLVAA